MIEEVLKRGRENAVSFEYVAAVTGLPDRRAVQRQVAAERKEGALILSSTLPPGGLYLPADAEEVREFVKTLEHRGAGIFLALRPARHYLHEMEGQLELNLKDEPEEEHSRI